MKKAKQKKQVKNWIKLVLMVEDSQANREAWSNVSLIIPAILNKYKLTGVCIIKTEQVNVVKMDGLTLGKEQTK